MDRGMGLVTDVEPRSGRSYHYWPCVHFSYSPAPLTDAIIRERENITSFEVVIYTTHRISSSWAVIAYNKTSVMQRVQTSPNLKATVREGAKEIYVAAHRKGRDLKG